MPLIPAFERQTQADLCEFQDSQGSTEKPCLEKLKEKKNRKKKKEEKCEAPKCSQRHTLFLVPPFA
jgi:hypothetical protein